MSKFEKFNRSNVGGVIYALRTNDLKVGQGELSEEVGVAQGSISKIENGSLELGISLYYDILKYFDLTSEEFSELVDKYIHATLKMQKIKMAESKKKKLVSEEIANQAEKMRAAR